LINRLSADAVVVQKALTNNVASGLKAIFMVCFYSLSRLCSVT
jgi:hypothetical protein